MRAIVVAFTVCVLAAVLYGPAFAQVDLLNGSAHQGELQVGVYGKNSSGSMDNVREFDGRSLNPASLEYLEWLGYAGPWQYRVLGRYLFAHDADAAVGLNYMNRFGVSYKTSILTHRLEAIRAGDILLVAATPGVDDSPNQDFFTVRKTDDVSVRFTDSNQSFRLMAGSWVTSKDGYRQQAGRWNSGTGSRKHVIALPTHSDTSESTIGTDFRIGNATVVNYRYSDTKYGEVGSGITSIPILANLTRIVSDTKTSSIKARADISNRLYLTGFHVTKQRINTQATFVEGEPASMSIASTNAALNYLATDSLTLSARYRMTNQYSHIVPIVASGQIRNNSLSTKMKSSQLEATYSGIRHAFLKAGYERKDVSRSTQFTAIPFAELEPSSKADIVTGSIRYYPTTNLSLSANGSFNNTDRAGYAGTPNKKKQINANATYMLGDSLALYGDYSSLDERNDLVRIAIADIPAAVATDLDEEERIAAAGQGYDHEMTTTTLGTWYSVNSKLVLDANYSKIDSDASNLWILGLDGAAASNTVPNMVSYSTRNHQWSAGLTYSMSPKWNFYGRYILSNSDGRALLDPAFYPPGVGPTWLPVDLRQHTYVLGMSHDLTDKDRLMLDFSVSEYVDRLNATNTGTYGVWRTAWSRSF